MTENELSTEQVQTKTELLPCPFCGGAASKFYDLTWYVGCLDGCCNVDTVASWNTRATVTPSEVPDDPEIHEHCGHEGCCGPLASSDKAAALEQVLRYKTIPCRVSHSFSQNTYRIEVDVDGLDAIINALLQQEAMEMKIQFLQQQIDKTAATNFELSRKLSNRQQPDNLKYPQNSVEVVLSDVANLTDCNSKLVSAWRFF